MSFNKKQIISSSKSFATALIIALAFRSLLFDPFNIPSGSMKPNLLIGDYIFVNKFSYGYSKFSFPFGLAPIKGRIFKSEPQRGDVIVFRSPQNPYSTFYIKRLIGLPGDVVQFRNGKPFINGKAISRKYEGSFTDPDTGHAMTKYRETLENGKNYITLDDTPFAELDNTVKFKVPEKHYFFNGDNRDHSGDSRISQDHGGMGMINEELLLGKVSIILFSCKAKIWEIWAWLTKMDYGRIFKSL